MHCTMRGRTYPISIRDRNIATRSFMSNHIRIISSQLNSTILFLLIHRDKLECNGWYASSSVCISTRNYYLNIISDFLENICKK